MKQLTVPIDGAALSNELQKRKINRNELSVEMGHSRDYITNVIRDNRTTKQTINYLHRIYNIPVDAFVPEIKEEPHKITIGDLEPDELHKIIKDAVYQALKEI